MKRRSDRSGRASLSSPGRPPVAGREEVRRFWGAIAVGMATEDAAVGAGVPQAVGTRWFRKAGGMPPAMFGLLAKPLSGQYLPFAKREEIALFRAQSYFMRSRSPARAGSLDDLSELRRNAATRSGDPSAGQSWREASSHPRLPQMAPGGRHRQTHPRLPPEAGCDPLDLNVMTFEHHAYGMECW